MKLRLSVFCYYYEGYINRKRPINYTKDNVAEWLRRQPAIGSRELRAVFFGSAGSNPAVVEECIHFYQLLYFLHQNLVVDQLTSSIVLGGTKRIYLPLFTLRNSYLRYSEEVAKRVFV